MYSLGCSYRRSYTVLDVGIPTPIAPQITSGAVWNALPRVGQTLDVSPGTLNDYFPALTSNTFEVFDGDPAGSGVSIYGPDSLPNIRAYMADSAQEGAILYLRWTVANSEGAATASVAASGAVLPALSAPTATLNVDLTGRVVTAWLTGISGVPTVIPTLDVFTAAGSDVAGGVTGTGTQGDPWLYSVPSSGSATDIVIGASIDNGVAPAWSETDSTISVPSDQTAPTATVTLAQPTYADGETVDAADIVPTISTAGNPALQLADLTAILMVDGTPVSLPHTAVEGEVLVPRVTASHPTGAIDATGNGVTVLPGFSLTESLPDAELEINGATGTVTITVTSPAVYATYDAGNGAGVFIFDSAGLATGPVNLVPPQVIDDGTPAEGETLTLTPGLWVYDPGKGGIGSPTYQWQADTAGNGTFADISGATSNSYTLTAGEAGDDVRVQESMSDNAGSRTANSAAVSVAGGVVTAPTRLDNATEIETRTNNAQTYTPVIQYTVPAGSDRLMIAAVSWRNAGSASIAPTLAFGGVAMTLEGVSSTAAPQLPASAIFTMRESDIPAGAQSFDIDFGLSVNGLTLHVLTYGGVDQTTPAGAMTAGTLGAVSTSYHGGVTVSAHRALVAVGASLEGAGQRPTTVSGDATERLESLSPGDSRAMLVLATGENTTAGAKTVIFTPDVDGQQAIAAAIEVFGS